jgi:hypothetical protein
MDAPAKRRAHARKALGTELRAGIEALAGRLETPRPATDAEPIRLHPANAAHDCQVRWYMGVVDPILRAAIELERLDYADRVAVGRRLRRMVREFLAGAERAEDLVAFLEEFEPGATAAGLLADMLRGHLVWGTWRVLEVTADNEVDHAAAAARLEANAERLTELAELLDALRDSAPARPAYNELIETVVGERPRLKLSHPSALRAAFGPDVRHHAVLAARQLRLLVNAKDIPSYVATTWLAQACQIATQVFPLLAHRTALLTWRLLNRAGAMDSHAVAQLVAGFYVTQAARIVSAGGRADDHVARYRGGDDDSLVEGYRTLAEGILRPFGALVVHLEAVACGTAPSQLGVRPLLGELEDALRATESELANLLAFGIARPLRNAGAHLDVVRSRSGRLCIAEEDGTLAEIDLPVLHRDYSVLRSALIGVDIACGLGYVLLLPANARQQPPASATTDAVLEQLATFAAEEVVRGFVTDLIAEGDRLTFTLHGDASALEVEAILALLEPHFDTDTGHVAVLTPEGDVLAEYRRQLDEPLP